MTKKARAVRLQYSCLSEPRYADKYSHEVAQSFPHEDCRRLDEGLTAVYEKIVTSMTSAASCTVPRETFVAKRPWISHSTLNLIEQRHGARTAQYHNKESLLHRQVKKSAKKDRERWLQNMAGRHRQLGGCQKVTHAPPLQAWQAAQRGGHACVI